MLICIKGNTYELRRRQIILVGEWDYRYFSYFEYLLGVLNTEPTHHYTKVKFYDFS